MAWSFAWMAVSGKCWHVNSQISEMLPELSKHVKDKQALAEVREKNNESVFPQQHWLLLVLKCESLL